jgi:hypothetical protein
MGRRPHLSAEAPPRVGDGVDRTIVWCRMCGDTRIEGDMQGRDQRISRDRNAMPWTYQEAILKLSIDLFLIDLGK